ncbi:hypothetical protein C8Q80DRAFT_1251961 [Daedaleopsis nitida]|nr:hypothetical protein C8Q80DRAFT_1251961 [Daedaleopsis nitida]
MCLLRRTPSPPVPLPPPHAPFLSILPLPLGRARLVNVPLHCSLSAKMLFAAAASALALASVALAQDQTIMVGQGGLKFDPQFVNATKGSVITFQFVAANHSVAESSFVTPCQPVDGGFNSGFVPIAANNTPGVWNLTVTDDTAPVWFYCPQQAKMPFHCTSGMVGAINGGVTGKDVNAFVAAASSATTIVYPSTVLSGVGAFATLAPTTTATGPAGSGTSAPSGSGSDSGSAAAPTNSGNAAGSLQASGVFAFLAAAFGVAVL